MLRTAYGQLENELEYILNPYMMQIILFMIILHEQNLWAIKMK
nr:MAG TPA: hypothetical protein [Caudoviricetes sp.]